MMIIINKYKFIILDINNLMNMKFPSILDDLK
jgi:hypothetical protein